VGRLVQPPCQSRVTYSRLHRTASRRVLNISREGDSTTSLGSLFQCSITLRGKKFFLMFRRSLFCFSLCPLRLVLSLGTTEKSLAPKVYSGHTLKTKTQVYLWSVRAEFCAAVFYQLGSAHLAPAQPSWASVTRALTQRLLCLPCPPRLLAKPTPGLWLLGTGCGAALKAPLAEAVALSGLWIQARRLFYRTVIKLQSCPLPSCNNFPRVLSIVYAPTGKIGDLFAGVVISQIKEGHTPYCLLAFRFVRQQKFWQVE